MSDDLRQKFYIASLKEQAAKLRGRAERCARAGYKKEPMRGYCASLEEAYREAAAVFQRYIEEPARTPDGGGDHGG